MQALTQYHHVMLYPSRLVIINRVSEAIVQEVPLTGRGAPSLAGNPTGLVVDDASSSLFLFSSAALPTALLMFHGWITCGTSSWSTKVHDQMAAETAQHFQQGIE